MKSLIIRLLEKLGLVTAGRYKLVAAKLRDAEVRAKKAATFLDKIQAESKEWKSKAGTAQKQAQSADKERTQQAARLEKLRTEVDKLREQLTRARASQEELQAARARVADAEHELAVAREHLMAIEVKLDILEGAANVLDTRTRSVIAQRAGETGATV